MPGCTHKNLIDIKVIENQEDTDDEALLRFLTFRLNTANNSGKVNETGPLVKIGKNCIDKKTCSLEPIIEFLNNRVVATHNLYQFQPDNESIKTAEKLNLINKTSKVYGASIDTVFARFSGTLSQNFGFCGPGYLKDFTKWNMKARKAFGEFLQENAKYRSEWLRQYNYGVYAFLDAGKTLQAKQMLCKYLSVEAPEDVPVRDSVLSLSPWEHAVFARFCAETRLIATGMRYVESTALSGKIKPPCNHPWQLWLKNCALIAEAAGEKKAARNLLLKSLEICLHKQMGPTVHMMALMPLFYLHKYSRRLEPDVDLKSIQGRLFKAMKCLHVPHFKIISSNRSLRSAFHDTSFSLEKLFPFAFR